MLKSNLRPLLFSFVVLPCFSGDSMPPSDEFPVSPDHVSSVQGADGPGRALSPPLVTDSIPIPAGPAFRPRAQLADHALTAPAATPGHLAVLLVLLVCALAFLLASFPARNTDLWMHLASGRRLAGALLPSGTAPPAPADLPVSPTWLYDLLAYGLYEAVGGAGLVLVKALLVVGLALVMMRLSRAGPGWWLPAFCTALALVAMSTRLLLQPATASCLMLALTLWFLRADRDEGGGMRDEKRKADGARSSLFLSSLIPHPSSLLRLLVLFLVWANLDRWFVLGLATVALVWLGQVLDEALGTGGPQGSWPASLLRRGVWFVLLVAVCLLNPAHVHAFTLPPELGASAGPMLSPFQRAYFATLGLTPATFAYFPLLVLSLLSFVLDSPRWSWRRFLPWLGLAAVSAVQARAVPFFAVVAGPVLAWNLQEFLARQQRPVWRPAFAVGHLLAGVLLLGLPVAAWPGWLQAPPFEPRRWAVEAPPSLEQGAAGARRALQEGTLAAGGHGLHVGPDSAHIFAWFCPEERGLRDDRLAAALRGDETAPADWAERMRAAGIDHVVLYDTDRGRLFAALGRLLGDPHQWPLLDVQGYLVILGWRDPAAAGAADPFHGRELDLRRRAFLATEVRKAPAEAPERRPEPRPWWEAFWKPVPPRPVDQDEATMYLFQAEACRASAPRRRLDVWERSQLAGLVGAAGTGDGPSALLGMRLRLALVRPLMPQRGARVDTLPLPDLVAVGLQGAYARQQGDIPPALLYLAIRAARRAVAVKPDDAQAYLVLGESYLRLRHATQELVWGDQLRELAPLRQVQASAALNQAVTLNPDLAQAHFSLSRLYGELGCLDLALSHLRHYVRLMQKAGPPPGVSTAEFRDQQAAWDDEARQLAQEVEKRQDRWEVAAAGKSVLERAVRADKEGLAGKARDLLLDSDVTAFGAPGMALELQLLLRTGRPRLVWEWTGPEQEAALGVSYHWLRAQALAATGDYAPARQECEHLARKLAAGPQGQDPAQARVAIAQLAGKRILDEPLGEGSLAGLFLRARGRFEFRNHVNGLAQSLKREAELCVVRGLLALEEGDVDEAEALFRVALTVWKDEASAASGAGLDFGGRAVAQACLEWIIVANLPPRG
jgi:hypothetical protein